MRISVALFSPLNQIIRIVVKQIAHWYITLKVQNNMKNVSECGIGHEQLMKDLPSILFFIRALSAREQAKLRRSYRQLLEYIVECRGPFGLWIEYLLSIFMYIYLHLGDDLWWTILHCYPLLLSECLLLFHSAHGNLRERFTFSKDLLNSAVRILKSFRSLVKCTEWDGNWPEEGL